MRLFGAIAMIAMLAGCEEISGPIEANQSQTDRGPIGPDIPTEQAPRLRPMMVLSDGDGGRTVRMRVGDSFAVKFHTSPVGWDGEILETPPHVAPVGITHEFEGPSDMPGVGADEFHHFAVVSPGTGTLRFQRLFRLNPSGEVSVTIVAE